MTDKLFVYGSLMGGIQSPIATYLKSNSIFLGEGFVNGLLLDLGHYPGLVYNENLKTEVVGHLFQLKQPKEMMPNLDHYECVGPKFEMPNQYRRELIEVKLNQEKVECWAYLYNLPIEGIPIIKSGNYLTHFQQSQKYQSFVASLYDFNRKI